MSTFNQPERRGAPRIDLEIDGSIKSCGRYTPRSCVVRNISETGAKLQVESVDYVPDAFQLHLEDEGFSTDCVVVWRSQTEVGVVFQSAPKL